ncbi:unnamed protein product [Umbelopsis ramanniana]
MKSPHTSAHITVFVLFVRCLSAVCSHFALVLPLYCLVYPHGHASLPATRKRATLAQMLHKCRKQCAIPQQVYLLPPWWLRLPKQK